MRKCRLFTALVIVLAAVFALSGAAFAATKIRISECNSPTHPQTIGLEAFKAYVEANTKKALEVAIYCNSQLGGERESVEQVKNGSLEMATASAGPITTFNKKFMVLDIPFAFNNYEIAWMVLDSAPGEALLKSCEDVGLKGLSYMENGFRHVTNNARPIKTVEDFKGLKIRTMEAPMHMANFKLLGANPTPVPWTELYMTLQQKIVDGQENPLANIWEVKMYEVQKFVSLTGHIYDPMPLVANLKWFNALPADQRAVIEKGAILGANISRFVNMAREDELAKLIIGKGTAVNEVAVVEKVKMKAASQPGVIAEIKKAGVDQAFIDMWMKGIAKAEADVKSGL